MKQSFLKNKLNQNGKFFKIIAFPNLQLRNHFSTILLFRKFTNLITTKYPYFQAKLVFTRYLNFPSFESGSV